MQFEYKTRGTCSSAIRFDLEDNIVKNVEFCGGCSGNLQGISKLIDGMDVDAIIDRVKGIHCGPKDTSCPDQLSKALELAKEKLAKAE